MFTVEELKNPETGINRYIVGCKLEVMDLLKDNQT